MEGGPGRSYSIGELAERSGVSRRTVRFYVQRGLIDPPEGRGRGSAYHDGHLEQIRRVRALQREGLELEAIKLAGADRAAESPLSSPALLFRIPLQEGLCLELDSRRAYPDPRLILELSKACAQVLSRFAGGGTRAR